MNPAALNKLEYYRILGELERFAMSYLGIQHIRNMTPLTQLKAIRHRLDETEEARALLNAGASVPIPSLEGIELILDLIGTGYVLTERDFGHLIQFLRSCRQLIKYMENKSAIAPTVSSYASSMHELKPLLSELERSIHAGRVVDGASKDLAKIRKKILVAEERIKRKLDSLVSRYKGIMQEHVISKRGDRYVLPIKKEFRKMLNGSVLDESASGQTVFIEPSELQTLQMELNLLHADEAREETKVLSELTSMTEQYEHELRMNADTVGIYDFIIARGKYALSIGGRNVGINQEGLIRLRSATHPLIGASMVPLDFAIGDRYKTLIITGPNTGGKTSALKTVGLITLMVQSGLLVPVGEGSQCAVFDEVAVDIGDGQSLEHALSTFSAHIRNIREILQTAGRSTLILLDEMASGTDPGEGVGLSIAILEELHKRQSTVVVTTHFTEIKNFAARTPGFENARMEFDTETLEPLYRLRIGEAGHSYAFVIAAKLGIPESIIARSREITEAKAVTARIAEAGETSAKAAEIDSAAALPQAGSASTEAPEIAEADEASTTAPASSGSGTRATATENVEAASPPLFRLGDRVYVPYLKRSGTVYETMDAKGNVGVMIQQAKHRINHKRLKPFIAAEELYPDDYDLDIVFESKENRKKRNLMKRKHIDGLTIETKPDEI
ncbi:MULTISPECIES: endonuclease MutS2 [Paenibacillus]|uniref:DNA mismatch repair protein MutS domain protein n=1 Tax=Paenibacillus lactis 154 TaxID=743719 RepID=G4HFI3_9BACL|nr:DNA mismatch repair protein MutS [Paenibacillus lactis]EHB64500.1 DNA mismatch repair protein MutS domain protein [Paenibacillus lactis 154]MCM3495115.1 DNA mismatch repair protein MutS [Paenibacillus lactis]